MEKVFHDGLVEGRIFCEGPIRETRAGPTRVNVESQIASPCTAQGGGIPESREKVVL